MNNRDRCIVCGAEATVYFDGNANIHLCSNPVCEQVLIDEINGELQIAAADQIEEQYQ